MVRAVRQRSLVGSIVALAVALAAPLLVVTALSINLYVKAERERVEAVARLTGDGLRERVDRDLAEMISLARGLATSPAIEAGDLARFDAQARALVDVSEVTVTLSEIDGRRLVDTSGAPGAAMPIAARPEIAGRLVASRQPVVSHLSTDGLTGRDVVLVSAPVIGAGAVDKVVSLMAPTDHFTKLLARQDVAEPYSVAIVDGERRVIARAGAASAVSPVARDTELASAATMNITHKSSMADWTIVTGVERAALEAPLRRSLAALGVLAFTLIGIGAAVALVYGRSVGASVPSLVAAAQAVGRGEPVAVARGPFREANLIADVLCRASRTVREQRAALDEARALLEARVLERGRELAASRTLYQLLAENMTDMVVLRARGGALSYVSPSSLRLLGHAPAAFAERDLRASIHPDDLAAFDAAEASIGPGQPIAVAAFRARRADGGWIWIEAVNDFLASAAPGAPDVISTWRDVSERRRQAEELRMARDSAELAQARAESGSRAKSEFILLMNHEIRTPLTTVKGFADLLAETGSLTPEQSRQLGLITRAASTLIVAVDDILDYAKSDTGTLTIEPSAFALAPLMERVTDLARPAAERRGLVLSMSAAPDLPAYVSGDERRLRQVLVNFLNDSIAVARGGVVALSARGPQRGDAAGAVRFAVSVSESHSGGGVPRRPADPAGNGGVGLPLARRLVGLMGGRMERAAAGEAEGHRFLLPLPMTLEPSLGSALAPARPARILVAEDSVINQEIVRAMLERAGHAVDVVDDGEAAVTAVKSQTYDLVLMDVLMPGLDGIGATRRIRALQHPSRRTPIVAMTANVMPDRVRAFAEAGMNGHIAKPFDRATLAATLAAQLSSVVLLGAEESGAGPSRPAVFDRASYDSLRASLGADGALTTLRGFIALLDGFDDSEAGSLAAREEAETVAAGAERLGFLDLANAYARLTRAAEGPETSAALRRCRVARDLAHRTLHELTGPDRPDVSANVALL